MKIKTQILTVGLALTIGSATHAELSANIGVTSNYVWRGLTQTDDDAAVSGGIDYAHDSGFYLGTWASNVSFDDDKGSEVDLYGGFASSAGDLGYDLGVIHYLYPSYNDADFTEIYAKGSFKWLEAGVYYTVDTEAGGDDDHVYYFASASYEFLPSWSAGLTVGYYDLDGGSDEVTHGQIDITKSADEFGDFTFSVSQTNDWADDPAVEDADDVRVFVSWSKSF